MFPCSRDGFLFTSPLQVQLNNEDEGKYITNQDTLTGNREKGHGSRQCLSLKVGFGDKVWTLRVISLIDPNGQIYLQLLSKRSQICSNLNSMEKSRLL